MHACMHAYADVLVFQMVSEVFGGADHVVWQWLYACISLSDPDCYRPFHDQMTLAM